MIRIKPTSTLLFVALLTGWVHFTSSQPPLYPQDPYVYFLFRLEHAINASGPDVLPFSLKYNVIQNLMWISNDFRELCLYYDEQEFHDDTYEPVTALIRSINRIFHNYIYGANTNFLVLESIKSADPIGFNVYLTMTNVTITSPNFTDTVAKFQATMNQRLRLLNMKTNDSCFEIFGTTENFPPNSINIPSIARDQIATEYKPIGRGSIDAFTGLVTREMFHMYSIETDVDNYRQHEFIDADDVQILHGTAIRQEQNGTSVHVLLHPICVHYKSSIEKVYVYGGLKGVGLDPKQEAIINKLYPLRKGFHLDSRTAVKNQHPNGGLFAIIYASMLLQDESPAKFSVKMNKVCGDESLYMRIHILNMLANGGLAPLK